nr:uncharacterized protein LOC114822290 [Malus domestica]
MAKVLTNRLKLILPHVISPPQSVFVLGRLISDNYLVAAEVAHYMHKRSSGVHGFMALKLDISKAYDRVEWKFLEAMMHRMGFSNRWIRTIMLCITTVTYSFKLNGDSVGYMHPEREGFSALLTKAELDGDLQGIKVCRAAPSIHHLFFAGDSFLFARVLILKLKKETFTCVKDMVWKKLQSWRGGLLSSTGRELLVKTVAQALPLYSMQCFLLPKSFCEELNVMIAKFWWSGDPGKRKRHWLNWRYLCEPKHEGGLGFRDLYAFNQALLAKQAWRFLHDPESLVFLSSKLVISLRLIFLMRG